MEASMSRGVVAAILASKEGSHALERPVVLQVADLQLLGRPGRRFRMVLSDGVHSLQGMLPTSMNHLVIDGELRRGTVLRLLQYVSSNLQNRRVIIVIKLEILPTDCALIGCPTMYEATPTQPYGVPCSGSLVYNEPCVLSRAQRVADK